MNNTLVAKAKTVFSDLQDFYVMSISALVRLPSVFKYRREALDQMNYIGVGSLFLALTSALAIGLVLALEWGTRLQLFGAKNLMGHIVSVSVIREIGPIVTGLMMAGRNGSKIAAELSSMVISEQIDAFRAFGTDPIKKLVIPRQVATVIMIVPVTVLADTIAMLGGYYTGVVFLKIDSSIFWISVFSSMEFQDILIGMVKPFFFGYSIATISCFSGLFTEIGAEGVGKAATRAVMYSSLSVLILDFLISKFIIALVP